MIRIVLRGEPEGKRRHRSRMVFPKMGKPFIHTYPDPEGAAYEKAFALVAKVAMGPKPLLDGPLIMDVLAIMKVPKSWSKRDRDAALSGIIRPTGKPDYDNLEKLASDAMNGIVYKDDAQIVRATVEKRYGEEPMLQVQVDQFQNGSLL